MFPKTLSENCDTIADRVTRLMSGVQTGSGASMDIEGSFLIGQGAGVESSHY
jgi:hypothetical protein